MSGTVRLTVAQAMVRWLGVQMTAEGDRFIPGIWAIFGHGNVAGLGEALHRAQYGDLCETPFPTWRGQNEQTMAHAALAFAKGRARRQAMAVTSSIGPGATNLVTAAALAHVNRLPLLVIAGDVFANRRPDPVLQQVEDFDDGTVSANDCFRPVVRYFDRITRPEQLLSALPRALRVMTDPANCGPVCLSFCQDVQAEAFDWPEAFLAPVSGISAAPRLMRASWRRLREWSRAPRACDHLRGRGHLFRGRGRAGGFCDPPPDTRYRNTGGQIRTGAGAPDEFRRGRGGRVSGGQCGAVCG